MGVEPTSEAWEASILPMNYSRAFVCANISLPQTNIKIKRKIDNGQKKIQSGKDFGPFRFCGC